MANQTNNMRAVSGPGSWADGNCQDREQAKVKLIFQKLVRIRRINNFSETGVNRPAAHADPMGFLTGRPASKA
jgi:hypothetical protein